MKHTPASSGESAGYKINTSAEAPTLPTTSWVSWAGICSVSNEYKELRALLGMTCDLGNMWLPWWTMMGLFEWCSGPRGGREEHILKESSFNLLYGKEVVLPLSQEIKVFCAHVLIEVACFTPRWIQPESSKSIKSIWNHDLEKL